MDYITIMTPSGFKPIESNEKTILSRIITFNLLKIQERYLSGIFNKIFNMYLLIFKRLLDLCMSLLGFIILFPIFIMVTIWLFFSNDGKPFFFQQRPGKNEQIFSIIKFKSMNDKKDSNGHLLPYDERITKVGAFIRKYSLDEIPQLINVIKGDMSIVGPRPLLVEYLPLYSTEQRKRHLVKPGITGWAQINGRNTISWETKFNLDVWYVHKVSLILDIRIIFLTIKRVIKKEGVNSSENLNMPLFTGINEFK